MPLCYAVSFSLAYTGPNASVMGNVSSISSLFEELPKDGFHFKSNVIPLAQVGNSYYHYTAVSSLEGNLLSLVQVSEYNTIQLGEDVSTDSK